MGAQRIGRGKRLVQNAGAMGLVKKVVQPSGLQRAVVAGRGGPVRREVRIGAVVGDAAAKMVAGEDHLPLGVRGAGHALGQQAAIFVAHGRLRRQDATMGAHQRHDTIAALDFTLQLVKQGLIAQFRPKRPLHPDRQPLALQHIGQMIPGRPELAGYRRDKNASQWPPRSIWTQAGIRSPFRQTRSPRARQIARSPGGNDPGVRPDRGGGPQVNDLSQDMVAPTPGPARQTPDARRAAVVAAAYAPSFRACRNSRRTRSASSASSALVRAGPAGSGRR